MPGEESRLKILFLTPDHLAIRKYNIGHHLFRLAIGRFHDVTYYGEGYLGYVPDLPIPGVIKKSKKKYDLIITHHWRHARLFKGLGQITDTPKVHIAIDHYINYRFWNSHVALFNDHKYDMVISRTMPEHEAALATPEAPAKKFLLPYGVETHRYKKQSKERKIYDVMASWNKTPSVYPIRHKIHTALAAMNINVYMRLVYHEDYIRTINQSRIFVNSNNAWNTSNQKFTEVLACGTFMLGQEPRDLEELYGLKPGVHYVHFNDIKDMQSKIKYYLKNETEREKIATEGMQFVRTNHNNDVVVKKFIDLVRRELL